MNFAFDVIKTIRKEDPGLFDKELEKKNYELATEGKVKKDRVTPEARMMI